MAIFAPGAQTTQGTIEALERQLASFLDNFATFEKGAK